MKELITKLANAKKLATGFSGDAIAYEHGCNDMAAVMFRFNAWCIEMAQYRQLHYEDKTSTYQFYEDKGGCKLMSDTELLFNYWLSLREQKDLQL